MLVKGAALDVDFNLDVAEAAEGEAEEVVVGVLDVVAVEAGEFTVADFDDGVGGELLFGELDVVHAHAESGMPGDGIDRSQIAALALLGQRRVLEGILRGNYQVDLVEAGRAGEVLHDGLVAYVQGVE